MAIQKRVIDGKVKKNSSKKFKIEKVKVTELDVDIDIEEDGDYAVEKLSIDDLPATIDDANGKPVSIRWLNNFSIKKNGQYINQSYKVTIEGLSALLGAGRKLVLWDGNTNNGKPWVYSGVVENDTFELTDGDPGTGIYPP